LLLHRENPNVLDNNPEFLGIVNGKAAQAQDDKHCGSNATCMA
jgi:hypothetical protein